MELYQQILKAFFGQNNDERLSKIKKLQGEIQKNKDRIDNAMRMMLDGEIESSEYKAIKSRFEDMNTTLLRARASLEVDKVDYTSKINGCFNLLMHLDKFYAEASVDIKQEIVGLNFPEKMIFENGKVQTQKMNEVLSLIMLEDRKLETKKKGTTKKIFFVVPGSALAGIQTPNLLIRSHKLHITLVPNTSFQCSKVGFPY